MNANAQRQFTDDQIGAIDLAQLEATLGRGEAVMVFGRHYKTREALPQQVRAALATKDVPEEPEDLEAQIKILQAKLAKQKGETEPTGDEGKGDKGDGGDGKAAGTGDPEKPKTPTAPKPGDGTTPATARKATGQAAPPATT